MINYCQNFYTKKTLFWFYKNYKKVGLLSATFLFYSQSFFQTNAYVCYPIHTYVTQYIRMQELLSLSDFGVFLMYRKNTIKRCNKLTLFSTYSVIVLGF